MKCTHCKDPLTKYDNIYECPVCTEKKFLLCEPCRLTLENPHQHKLRKVTAQPVDYPYFTSESFCKSNPQSKLFLGPFGAALPNSETITKHNIKAILSLIHFDTTEKSDSDTPLNQLQQMFFDEEGKYSPIVVRNEIVYFHINVPDLYHPDQLESYQCEDLLPKSIVYIDLALKIGNVLVHCEKGQRRSATVVIAWLIAHKYSTLKAIDTIDETYAGDEDWGDAYRRHRCEWIKTILADWEAKYRRQQKKWILNPVNAQCILDWKEKLVASPSLVADHPVPEHDENINAENLIVVEKTSKKRTLKRKRDIDEPLEGPSSKKQKVAV